MVLIYIHAVFSKQPINCLVDIEGNWSRDGILRVEIISNAPDNYTLADSYRKEYGPFEQYAYEQELAANATSLNSTDLSDDNSTDSAPLIHTNHSATVNISSSEDERVG